MSSMIGKVLVTALVAGAAPLPYGSASSNTTTASWTTVSGTAVSSSSMVASQPPTSILSPAQSSAAAAAAASAAAANRALASKLLTDSTQVDRFNDLLTVDGAGKELLSDDVVRERIVFDFNKAPAAGEGGRILLATEDNFPILTEFGLATAVAFLGPCGMNTPHIHPRAAEFLTLVQGELQTGFVLENGFLVADKDTATVTQISANLTAFQSTIFPQGSIHFQLNPTCEPATFVSTLNSADPGTGQIAQNFFSLDAGIVNTALNGFPEQISADNIATLRQHIPNNLALEIEQCAMRCGLSH